jgi:hypothetical protein
MAAARVRLFIRRRGRGCTVDVAQLGVRRLGEEGPALNLGAEHQSRPRIAHNS